MNDVITQCLDKLRTQRAQLDDAIKTLEALLASQVTTVAEIPASARLVGKSRVRRRKRAATPPNGGQTYGPSTTCFKCDPPRKLKNAASLRSHEWYKHKDQHAHSSGALGSTLGAGRT